MNYIWEVVLAAKADQIEPEELNYRQAEAPSPYMEVSFDHMNTVSIEEKVIEVNPFYRFQDVFERLLDINNKGYEKTKALFFDAVMHSVAHIDLKMGMSRGEYYVRFLIKELEEGHFGQGAAEAIQLFSHQEKKCIGLGLLEQADAGNGREIFRRLCKKVYENFVIYASTDYANELFVYLGRKETEEERKRIRFLIDTFLPIGAGVEIFYTEHFGILDQEDTMILDQILLI